MEGIVALLIPIFICVVLPVAIVLIIAISNMKADDNRAKVIIKAIESNNNIDADKLAESFKKPQKTAREILNLRLLRGCIFGLLGLTLIIVGFVNFLTGTEFGADPVTVPMVFGSAPLAIGVSYLIVYFVTRKQVLGPENKDDK